MGRRLHQEALPSGQVPAESYWVSEMRLLEVWTLVCR